mmetsp:Transcript_22550/g.50018  ORF Transcript_22550/g.50018 Transcript_22550/m.50018 type:complete len:365 (+) Transcript_22550:389-1483(+)
MDGGVDAARGSATNPAVAFGWKGSIVYSPLQAIRTPKILPHRGHRQQQQRWRCGQRRCRCERHRRNEWPQQHDSTGCGIDETTLLADQHGKAIDDDARGLSEKGNPHQDQKRREGQQRRPREQSQDGSDVVPERPVPGRCPRTGGRQPQHHRLQRTRHGTGRLPLERKGVSDHQAGTRGGVVVVFPTDERQQKRDTEGFPLHDRLLDQDCFRPPPGKERRRGAAANRGQKSSGAHRGRHRRLDVPRASRQAEALLRSRRRTDLSLRAAQGSQQGRLEDPARRRRGRRMGPRHELRGTLSRSGRDPGRRRSLDVRQQRLSGTDPASLGHQRGKFGIPDRLFGIRDDGRDQGGPGHGDADNRGYQR